MAERLFQANRTIPQTHEKHIAMALAHLSNFPADGAIWECAEPKRPYYVALYRPEKLVDLGISGEKVPTDFGRPDIRVARLKTADKNGEISRYKIEFEPPEYRDLLEQLEAVIKSAYEKRFFAPRIKEPWMYRLVLDNLGCVSSSVGWGANWDSVASLPKSI